MTPISPGLMRIRLKGIHSNVSVASTYEPTLDDETLQNVLDSIPSNDSPVLAHDLRSRTEAGNTINKQTVRYGNRQIDFATTDNIQVMTSQIDRSPMSVPNVALKPTTSIPPITNCPTDSPDKPLPCPKYGRYLREREIK